MQALILYLQPLFDGGAAHIDNCELVFTPVSPVEENTWGAIKSLYR
jgi:hypothetical protein